jgi:hypothetical protein
MMKVNKFGDNYSISLCCVAFVLHMQFDIIIISLEVGTPSSSTTKTGRHDIAEILLKVALNTKNQIKSNHK